jgi:ParB/RepB/Spo0J family partition protein
VSQKPKIQNIDPRDIGIPAVRIDSAFEEDILAMFADDIKKTGIEQPLLVAKSEGKLWVIDGRHRLEQALLNGFPTVPCMVRDMDLKSLQLRNLASNRLRGKTKLSEEIKVVGDLYDTYHATIEEIVDKTGMRRDRLETMILISQAHPDILRALDEDLISFGHATQIIRFKEREHQAKMLQTCKQYHPKVADLKGWVDESLVAIDEVKTRKAAAGPPPPPGVPSATCTCCQEAFPLPQLTAPTLCRGCYSLLIQAYTEVQKLEAANARQEATKGIPERGSGIADQGGL